MSGDKGSVDVQLLLHNQTIYNKLKRGDLIEFDRGPYSHWAVYIGDDWVVHRAGEDNDGLNGNIRPEHLFTISSKTFDKARVCCDELWNVVLGSKMIINNANDKKRSPLHPDDIVQNALSVIGQEEYNLLTKNCEHFATWCRYGVEISDQVDNVVTGAAIGMAGAAVIGAVYAVTKYWGPNKAQTQDDEDD